MVIWLSKFTPGQSDIICGTYSSKYKKQLNLYKTAKCSTGPNSKVFSDDNVCQMIISVFGSVENIVGKGENWLPAFSPFPTMFQKSLSSELLKFGIV